VLCATALGNSVTEAQQKAYQQVNTLSWDNMYFRKDIGYRAIAREKSES
jgi:phosphoribosylamine--glycine ligase